MNRSVYVHPQNVLIESFKKMGFQLLLCLLTLMGIAAGNGANFGQIVAAHRAKRATVLDGGNFVVVDGFVNIVNGKVISGKGCYYHDGKVTDKGKTRTMNSEEQTKLKQYMRNVHSATEKFEQQMQRMFAPPFPFGGAPMAPPPQLRMPQVPCFCSSSSCSKFMQNSMDTSDGAEEE